MSRHPAHSDVFLAVADPTRRAILDLLREGEQSVSALTGRFPVTLSAVSQHIRVLREAGLVAARKQGRERVYRLNAVPLRDVYAWAGRYEAFWDEKLGALARYLDERQAQEGTNEREG